MTYFERKHFDWGDELDGKTLAEAKHIINTLSDKFGTNAKLIVEYGWENVDFVVEVEREPTFEELTAEKIKKEKKEKADRAKFDKLKAQYGW